MDDAASFLGREQAKLPGLGKTNKVFIGVDPHFVKVYDQGGKALGPRVTLNTEKGRRFIPGIYAVDDRSVLHALLTNSNGSALKLGTNDSLSTSRPPTAKESAAQVAEDEKAKTEGRESVQSQAPIFFLGDHVADPARFQNMLGSVSDARIFVFVLTYSGGSGKGGGESKQLYASPIEGREDGEPANEPPWPVSLQGPKLVSRDSDPTFTAKVDWAANGNYSVTSQAIVQVGESIHYQWELFDITKYAKQQLAKAPPADPDAPLEKTLDERIKDYETSKAGTGGKIASSANREFKREFEDWWKDTKRAHRDAQDPSGDTLGEKLSHRTANLTTLELAPVSLLITSLGAALRWMADLFAGPTEQKEVPFKDEGIFLVRVISTPAIHEDRKGKRMIRPPSVAVKAVEVTKMDTAVKESLDEPGAQLAELQAQIDQAVAEGNKSKADYLRELLADRKKQLTGSVGDLLAAKIGAKQAELDKFREDYPTLSAYSRERDVDILRDQLVLFVRHDRERKEGKDGLPPMNRVNATLVSEVSGQPYPLLISAGPMAMQDGQHRWMISDVTNREGDAYIGLGPTPSKAFHAALVKFGDKAAYGRGRIGVHTDGMGFEEGAENPMFVDSAPADWAIAEKRLDDLTTLLATLGLFVATAGTGAAILGAALAARRLIMRWQSGHLELDGQTVGDLFGLFGGLGVAGELAATGLRVQRFEKAFALVGDLKASEESLAAASKALAGAERLADGIAKANEILGYAGVVWGNLQFIDGMMTIAEQERSGALTHAAARRARAEAISSAVQNNGLLIAGNVLKARAANKAAEKSSGKKTAPHEKASAREVTLEEKPSPEYAPAEGDHAAQRAGEAVPLGERRATVEEIKAAVSPDLREMLAVDPTLEGNDVRVDYTVDSDTKLITDIRIRYSPDTRPSVVSIHEQTVRTMQKYQGFSGRVQRAISWVADRIGFQTLKPEQKKSFEAALEVQKLPKAIAEQMEHMRKQDPDARRLAEAELDHLELQLEQHMRTLGFEEAGEGAGFVAAKGLSKAKQKEYADLKSKLREHAPGSDEHRDTRREMYELIGGDLSIKTWTKVYKANMERANKANESVKAEFARLGWTDPKMIEKPVSVPGNEWRRLDIADTKKSIGYEVKMYDSHYITASAEIVEEVRRDAKLVDQGGWAITWILIDTHPSGPLLKMLHDAKIKVEFRTIQGSGASVLTDEAGIAAKARRSAVP